MTLLPALSYDDFKDTGQSLHMWMQIVGKFRLQNTPWTNHSWHVPFYIDARGLSTSIIHCGDKSYSVLFDFKAHALVVNCTNGNTKSFALEPMSVADFHTKFIKTLDDLGAPSTFHSKPNEVPAPVAFEEQTKLGAYDKDAAFKFWQALVAIDSIFQKFRARFIGKVSPNHFFWGSFDLAQTRFSGREAPRIPAVFPPYPMK